MAPPVLRVGLIGHGTVGRSFAHHLQSSADRLAQRLHTRVRLTRIAVRHPDAIRVNCPDVRVTDDAASIATDPGIDLVVEASGAREADTWLTTALARGAAAISANKQAIARSLPLLRALAERHPYFHCEGAVAAAIPIVRTLRDALDGEEIHAIRGVLNGTSTFVLSGVERGASWEDAVAQAEREGLAERGSLADFDGSDAAAKLAILATTAWRTPISRDRVRTRGLDARAAGEARAAAATGQHLRLVAEAWIAGAPHLLVEPRRLDATDPLASVSGVTNAIELQATLAGQLRWFGPGAGGDRTASALLADLASAARALLATTAGRAAA